MTNFLNKSFSSTKFLNLKNKSEYNGYTVYWEKSFENGIFSNRVFFIAQVKINDTYKTFYVDGKTNMFSDNECYIYAYKDNNVTKCSKAIDINTSKKPLANYFPRLWSTLCDYMAQPTQHILQCGDRIQLRISCDWNDSSEFIPYKATKRIETFIKSMINLESEAKQFITTRCYKELNKLNISRNKAKKKSNEIKGMVGLTRIALLCCGICIGDGLDGLDGFDGGGGDIDLASLGDTNIGSEDALFAVNDLGVETNNTNIPTNNQSIINSPTATAIQQASNTPLDPNRDIFRQRMFPNELPDIDLAVQTGLISPECYDLLKDIGPKHDVCNPIADSNQIELYDSNKENWDKYDSLNSEQNEVKDQYKEACAKGDLETANKLEQDVIDLQYAKEAAQPNVPQYVGDVKVRAGLVS